jgi:hypothetical protein
MRNYALSAQGKSMNYIWTKKAFSPFKPYVFQRRT